MSKFDTHGGYFAPQDYTRINTGGSHEENPNGGVQLGVDQQGVPNLLEEGEPVYKDYVYSDNIKASKKFLEANGIPVKYEGKLYSEIADSFFEEAEDRPYDPVSRNGLEAMLGRLAEAQEQQKQDKERRSIERELKSLSPEELDALEQELMAASQPQPEELAVQPEVEEQPEMAMPEEDVPMEEMPVEEVPTMAEGGPLGKRSEEKRNERITNAVLEELGKEHIGYDPETGIRSEQPLVDEHPAINIALMAAQPGTILEKALAPSMAKGFINSIANGDVQSAFTPGAKITKAMGKLRGLDTADKIDEYLLNKYGMAYEDLGKSYGRSKKELKNATKLFNQEHRGITSGQYHFAKNEFNKIKEGRKVGYILRSNLKEDVPKAVKNTEKSAADIIKDNRSIGNKVGKVAKTVFLPGHTLLPNSPGIVKTGVDLAPLAVIGGAVKYGKDAVNWGKSNFGDVKDDDVFDDSFLLDEINSLANGGRIANTFLLGGYDDRDPWRILDLDKAAHNETYHDILDWQPGGFNSVRKVHYLRNQAPAIISPATTSTQANTGFTDVPQNAVNTASNQSTGTRKVYRSVPLPDLTSANSAIDKQIELETLGYERPNGVNMPISKVNSTNAPTEPVGMPDRKAIIEANRAAHDAMPEQTWNGAPIEPTFPRYAGAIGSGILGLYNALQKPDRYVQKRINPYVPTGHINLQNERYMPIDQNMIQNQMLAQGNSTQRALRNSGLGPSSAAAILAADNNTTGNLGQGFIQAWQANNQQRNGVLAANNQNEATRAQFDYGVDAAKQRALSMAEMANAQNDLMIQRLNYQAEADKYNALSNQINAGLSALSDIGRENFIRNQINTNTNNEGYVSLPNGIGRYLPYYYGYRENYAKCGGKIKKNKK